MLSIEYSPGVVNESFPTSRERKSIIKSVFTIVRAMNNSIKRVSFEKMTNMCMMMMNEVGKDVEKIIGALMLLAISRIVPMSPIDMTPIVIGRWVTWNIYSILSKKKINILYKNLRREKEKRLRLFPLIILAIYSPQWG